MTLTEIRAQAHAVASTALARGADAALSLIEACWAARAATFRPHVVVGYHEAWRAVQAAQAAPDDAAVRARAAHALTIYVKVTALPVETGGFGVERVLVEAP